MTRTELRDELQSIGERIETKLDTKFAILIEMFKTQEANAKAHEAKIDAKLSDIDAKYSNQKAWFIGTAVSVVVATCTIMSFIFYFKFH